MTFARTAAAVALSLMSSTSAAFALPPAPPSGAVVLAQRTIAGNELYENVAVILAGTVTVSPAASLTLRGTQILAAPGAHLIVEGVTSITGSSSSLSGGTITVKPGGNLTLANLTAQSASLMVGGTASVAGVTLDRAPGDAIAVTDGTLSLSGVTITAPGIAGVRAVRSSVTASGLTVSGPQGYAISSDRSSLNLDGVNVSSPADYGLWTTGGTIQMRNAAFDGDCGVYLSAGTSGSIRSSSFATKDHGITLSLAGAVAIRQVSFTTTATGLLSVFSPLDVDGINATAGVGRAVMSLSSPGTVTNGTIASTIGIETDGPSIPVVRNLNLAGTTLGVLNHAATAVDARLNWWGGTPTTSGAVLTIPALTAAP